MRHYQNALLIILTLSPARAFISPVPTGITPAPHHSIIAKSSSSTTLRLSSDPRLEEKFGGYTVKQRLREEVESPFRKVRLAFFGFSTGSAALALYFSTISFFKAKAGFADVAPIGESAQNCAINAAGVVVCGYLAYRDWVAGQANLKRIAAGGALARLNLVTGVDGDRRTVADYRRQSRVLLAVGGQKYVEDLARGLNADQLKDTNTLPQALIDSDVIVVPVIIDSRGVVGDVKGCWEGAEPLEGDRNFDITRANKAVAFPIGSGQWTEYLKSEIETAQSQGFDVEAKGFTITVKKNGKILRRATGQPRWGEFLGAMEVLDGSKFGMPGDTERYGA